jgi:hypothetical protein
MRACVSALAFVLSAMVLFLTTAPAEAQRAPCNPAVQNCG